ncbi:MAG TPA: polyphosphate kinase [Chitinophagales bacterium]|jgi:PPK2 family polyphosphate:nucleotide phosphotransferase|nr:polyphosphate kinase [Chitinophagales bacterium]
MGEIKISKISTKAPKDIDKEATKAKTATIIDEIKELQDVLMASEKKSLLVILQGMDASGKDGVTKNVFSGLNPIGVNVHSFKKPSDEEFAHDFLWRVHNVAPAKGEIKIFNRSHYEDVLIQRVHKWIDEKTVKQRFDAINNFEKLLIDNNTVILKFYMHVSLETQLERLEERKTNPKKMWKHKDQDWEERKLWNEYMKAYEDVFSNCNKAVEWQIIPTDHNWYKEFLIAEKVRDALKQMKLEYPKLDNNIK